MRPGYGSRVKLPAIPLLRVVAVLLAASSLAFATASTVSAWPATVAQNEPNAAGDIPDTQTFVRYTAREGYSVLIPEGWSRLVQGPATTFTSHYDGVRIVVGPRTSAAAALRGLAGHPSGVKSETVSVAGRRATRFTFTSESGPDPVTGKTVRLDDEAYVFVKGPLQAILHLWAPHGADNADQWRKIAQSFRW
jgi:hypothetical protein